ncbi:CNNM domain-containing protein [Enemella dayhoffiae]|uniref:CNNM domain-containing protein n=1 Tax=Enemella dayhoffiae TaxID=2016507 RepID=UPI001BB1811E|nr:CNNM domain-containing protein [Enemella dayhoffiae]
MVLGEMVPKNIAIAGPERTALILGPPMYAIAFILRPVLWLLNEMSNVVLRLMKVQPTDEVQSTVSEEDVPDYLEESHDEGTLEDNEHQLMSGALTMNRGHVEEVMIGTDRIVALAAGTTVAEAEQACAEHGHSRFPVRDGERWIGYVHLKDLLDPALDRHAPIPSQEIRDLVHVNQGATLLEALRPMQSSGAHLAMVTGPDEELVGWVMLEDVMETMIGTVSDDDRPA